MAIATVTITLLCWIAWKLFITYKIKEGKVYYSEIKNYPKYYVYDTSNRSLNPVFYIDTPLYKKELFQYYDSTLLGFKPQINFPAKFVVLFKEVYINNKSGIDSNLVEFIDFDTTCYGYIKGYVYKKFIYLNPPSNELTEKFNRTWENLKKNTGAQIDTYISSAVNKSPYGVQCDCK